MSASTKISADLSPLQLTAGRPILCIDDEATLLMLMTRFLSRAGYSSIVAATGTEALEVLKHQKPALILLDLQMPEMDGFSFLAHLRNNSEMRDVPVVLQTANVTKQNILKSMKLGISSALAKPYDHNTLIEKVQQTLIGCRKKSETQAAPPVQDAPATDEPAKPQGPTGEGAMSAVDLDKLIEQSVQSKALPFTVTEVQAVTESKESDAAELIEVIRQDPVLSGAIVRVANSVEYSRGKTRNLDEAVTALGFEQVAKLTAQLGILELADPESQPGKFSCYNYWMHTIVTANLAERFANITGQCEASTALVAGLLHDLSMATVAQVRPDLIIDLTNAGSADPGQFQHDEKAVLGWSFAQIGEKLMSKWEVPELISQAVGHHTDVKEGIEQLSGEARDLTLIIKACDILAHAALTDPLQNYPILLGADAMEMLLKQSNINQEGVNREVNAVVREAETLAMCNFEPDQTPPKLITKPMEAVAVVRPEKMPASPLNVFLEKAAHRVICFRTVNDVTREKWSAIYFDGALGGMRFADRSMRDFSARTDLQEFPTFCLAPADTMNTLKGAYGHLPAKLVTAPCWARELLPN
ncbi:MAG: HDOD domain-containing protein [Planctomycetes bacterium]|nr:HDOD domain-containing protein [Planctomycetota bacterium]